MIATDRTLLELIVLQASRRQDVRREKRHTGLLCPPLVISASVLNLLSKMTNAHHKLQETVSQKLTGGLNTKFIYEDNEKSRLNQEISRCGSSQVTRHILTTCFYIK